jgi:outer membrane protein
MTTHHRWARAALLAPLVLALLVRSAPAQAAAVTQPQAISLEQAIQLAEQQSEAIGIARSGVTRAQGDVYRAHSQYLPQINGSLAYTRTLKSQFQGLSFGSDSSSSNEEPTPPGPCRDYLLGPTATTEERLAGLEDAQRCALGQNPFSNLGNLGFGAENQFNLGLSLSQPLFTGGRISGQNQVAVAGKRSADIELTASRAQLQLDVTTAYFDAALSDRLSQIAESTLVQTEAVYQQTRLAYEVGNQAEFEMLRAQVTRDTQRPAVIQRRSERELAYARLKQLLNLPLSAPLQLTTGIQDAPAALPAALVSTGASDTSADARATVRQAAEAVEVQRGLLKVQRAERLPEITLTSQYGRVAYPANGVPSWNEFRTNWTVALGLQLPIFTGGRTHGDALVAEANVAEAELRLRQTSELAALDARSAALTLAEAEASWEASAGTAEQAAKAYQIAEVRYSEGISTQVELSDARLLMQQAQVNRALAARDLQVARVRLALLPNLPLGATGGASQQSAAQQMQQQLQQQMQQQAGSQQRSTQSPGSSAGGFTGQPGGGSLVP